MARENRYTKSTSVTLPKSTFNAIVAMGFSISDLTNSVCDAILSHNPRTNRILEDIQDEASREVATNALSEYRHQVALKQASRKTQDDRCELKKQAYDYIMQSPLYAKCNKERIEKYCRCENLDDDGGLFYLNKWRDGIKQETGYDEDTIMEIIYEIIKSGWKI